MTTRANRILIPLFCFLTASLAGCSRSEPDESLTPGVTIVGPSSGSVVDWSEDKDPAKAGFQTDVTGLLAGFGNTYGASLSLQVDGVTQAKLPDIDGTSFRFSDITLAPGFHALNVMADVGGARASGQSDVTVPQLPESLKPSLRVMIPDTFTTFSEGDDADADADGFQVKVSGALMNMHPSAGAETPALVPFVDGEEPAVAPVVHVQRSETDATAFDFIIPALTVPAGSHAVQLVATTGEEAASATLYMVVPRLGKDPGYSVSIKFPADQTAFTAEDDADKSLDGFQTDVTGIAEGFDDGATLELFRNGLSLSTAARAQVGEGGAFTFKGVTLPEGQNVLTLYASEIVDGDLIERSTFSVVTVPSLGGLMDVEITSPADGAVLPWDADSDQAAEGYQLDVAGSVTAPMGEPPVMALVVDGAETSAEAVPVLHAEGYGEGNAGEGGSNAQGEGRWDYTFRSVTLSEGVHQLAVLATQGENRALGQVTVAIPDRPAVAPAAAISVPANGSGIAADADGLAVIDVTGTHDGASAMTLMVDGIALSNVADMVSDTFEFAGIQLTEGTHVLQVQASDGRYSSLSEPVTVHVATFEVQIDWPSSGTVVYVPEATGVGLGELVGRVTGCAGCKGAATVSYQVYGDDAPVAVELDGDRNFRKAVRLSGEGEIHVVVTAQQAMEGGDSPQGGEGAGKGLRSATFQGTSFLAQKSVSYFLKPDSQRPAASVSLSSPADGDRLSWRDDADLSTEALECVLEAGVSGLSLGDATYEVYVDGVLKAGTADGGCRLTTIGKDVTGLTCDRISLGNEGAHVIRVTATLNDDLSTMVDDMGVVWFEGRHAPGPATAVLAIASPAAGAILSWKDDASANEGFQFDVTGRFDGVGASSDFGLFIDGSLAEAGATVGDGVFAFRSVTVPSGRHHLMVQASAVSYGVVTVASDTIDVDIPAAQRLSASAKRNGDGNGFEITGMAEGFGDGASGKIDVYVDGALSSTVRLEDLSQLQDGIALSDEEVGLSPIPPCHSVFFAVTGVEGLSHATGITQPLQAGSDCSSPMPALPSLVVTSPVSGAEFNVRDADSAYVSVQGVVVGAWSVQPSISMGGVPCQLDAAAATFSCGGDFATGEQTVAIRDEANGVQSAPVAIVVRNISGCPVTLAAPSAEQAASGKYVFNRRTEGVTLTQDASGVAASYTFSGFVPPECAGGTVTILKKSTDGEFVAEAKKVNILTDGSFAYKASLADGEDDAVLSFSAEKPFFSAAAGAQLSYAADFTVPTFVAGENDTFADGESATYRVYHPSDLRAGIKAPVERDGETAFAALEVTFSLQGVENDPMKADTVVISYDGASEPLLSEALQAEGSGAVAFTKRVLLPQGDWQLTISVTDVSGNSSSQTYHVRVDVGCGVTLASHNPGGLAVVAREDGGVSHLVLSGTSSCAGASYQVAIGGGEPADCAPSEQDGAFQCDVALSEDALVVLTAPDGTQSPLDVRIISNSAELSLSSPSLNAGGIIVVAEGNVHCGGGACAPGYAIDLDGDDATGTFHLNVHADMDAQYDLSCTLLLNGAALDETPCAIDERGYLDQNVTLPQGTSGLLTLSVTGQLVDGDGTILDTTTATTSLGVTIASKAPAAPVFLLPPGGKVTDCGNDMVTCVKDRHQGILHVWMDAPRKGIRRSQGFATGTTVSLTSAGDNTEAFSEATFESDELMTWFSANDQGDGRMFQSVAVTPMNLIHLGARDQDAYGNLSPVALVKSVDMFWNHFRRTFSQENEATGLGVVTGSGLSFGNLAAVGDFNGDGVDDVAVSAGNGQGPAYIMVYFGKKGLGIDTSRTQLIESAGFVSSLAAADVDHDGYDDLLAIRYNASGYNYPLDVRRGGASGVSEDAGHISIQYTFFPAPGYPYQPGFLNVRQVGDADGDGHPDLAFSEARELIYGAGTSVNRSDVFVVPTGSLLGKALETGTSTLSDLALWQVNGAEAESLGIGYSRGLWNIATIQEKDGMGLVIGAPAARKAYYFSHVDLESGCTVAQGGCDSSAATQVLAPGADYDQSLFGWSIALLDGDNDGVTDLYFGMPTASASSDDQSNYVFVANGSANQDGGVSFSTPAPFSASLTALRKNYFGTNVRPANLLGDGYEALVVSTNSTVDNRSFIYWNKSGAGLSSTYGSIIEGPSTFGSVTETGDFNGDGRLDLFFSAPSCAGCAGSGDKNGEFHVYY